MSWILIPFIVWLLLYRKCIVETLISKYIQNLFVCGIITLDIDIDRYGYEAVGKSYS